MPTRPGSAGGWQPLDTVSSTGPCDVRAIMNERPQPLDEARAHKNIAKMMGTELGIATAHPFQLGAVLALAYNTVALRSLGRQGTAKAPSSTPQCGYFEAWWQRRLSGRIKLAAG
jgi:hypothetical protein